MRTALLILSLLFVSAAPSVATAQEEVEALNESDFVLTRYTPVNVDAGALLRAIDSLYGRKLDFNDRKIDNLTILNSDLVIYETQARTKLIDQAIKQLDRAVEVPEGTIDSIITKTLTADDMELVSFSPKYFQVHDFYSLAQDLYGRELMVGDNWHQNLRMLSNNNIVIYEEKAEMPLIMSKLKALDNSQAPEENGETALMTVEYKPRHVSASGLMRGIQAFNSGVRTSRHTNSLQNNITLAPESGVIVIRDFPSQVEEIMATLERLDQPAPQVMVTCYVVHGVSTGDTLIGTPAEQKLQDQLKQILPFDMFELKALGLLRGTALAGTKLQLEMEGPAETGVGFNLRMMVGAYDDKTGALNLDECRFSTSTPERGQRELFSTATTVYQGEYAVLGVTGADPLFLVVQVHPIKRK